MARPPSRELLERASQIDRILRTNNIPFAFMGGLALNAWTVPAPTYDIDLCVTLDEGDVPSLVRMLEAEGFVPPPTAWIESVGREKFREFTVFWPFQGGMIATDFFLTSHPFQSAAIVRRRTVELNDGFRTEVLTPEDVLVYKLIAWRKKDQDGIDRLLLVQRTLDWDYVRKWSTRLGVSDRLGEALNDAGLTMPGPTG